MAGAGPWWVLGADSGGSGLRVALARAGAAGRPERAGEPVTAPPVPTGPAGIDAGELLDRLLSAAGRLRAAAGDPPVAAVCVGAAGMATLGGRLRAELPAALAGRLGTHRLALAADAVTAYAGALGERPGAVVAAGTGLIAVGTDLRRWRRADGWGHLLGDCGGGAWIGRAGLEAALRAHDGRPGGSAALLGRARERLGPPEELPGRLYPRTDRPAVLASFAPEVADCAGGGDPVSAGILRRAARHAADSAAAVCPAGADTTDGADGADGADRADGADGVRVALTGGLLKLGEPLLVPLRAALAAALPRAAVTAPAGDPLDGALLLAAGLARGAPRLPADPRLLLLRGGKDDVRPGPDGSRR
ncbi:N-acetylglucosamine kinase [Streptomyces aidingensis]|uniref:BadF-type ATPase n=1 Tax=Streptomyces aidingensis TaxID=910347 RepID=A0A1I1PJJ2_9ACTN|nr:BadF/BadG/BcrA/BcrD ATPase family protein [Streptomyces aidingensis]SFD07143.1 BadF-type ATPase [Streptomyces aidingensis]